MVVHDFDRLEQFGKQFRSISDLPEMSFSGVWCANLGAGRTKTGRWATILDFLGADVSLGSIGWIHSAMGLHPCQCNLL